MLKKEPPSPIALIGPIVGNVIAPLDLAQTDQDFVIDEIKWLLNAAANFLQVYQVVQQRLASENTRLIRKYAGDILADRKREKEMNEIRPQIWREEVSRSQPIAQAIPSQAEQSAPANNRLLANLSDYNLQRWGDTLEQTLKRVNLHLRSLGIFQERATLQGAAAKGDIALQNQLRIERQRVLEALQEMAVLINQAYGVKVTSPDELLGLIEE